MGNCLNCDKEILSGQQFCSACGQKTVVHRLSWHEIAHDTIHYITHGDKGFFYLLKSLAVRTGSVAREYVLGKRKKHFPPVNFFLIIAAIYVFIVSISAKPPVPQHVLKESPQLNNIQDPVKREKVVSIYKRAAQVKVFMRKHSNTVLMLSTPWLAFLFWLFYYKASFNYIEHLIANMYMIGFTLLVQAIFFIPLTAALKLKEFNFLLVLFLLFQAVYTAFFYYHFMGIKTRRAKLKAGLVSFSIIISWMLLSGTLIQLYIRNGFWGLLS